MRNETLDPAATCNKAHIQEYQVMECSYDHQQDSYGSPKRLKVYVIICILYYIDNA